MAKRMVNEAEEVNKLTEYVRQEDNKTIIGGNVEIDGNLSVNGSTPGGLHVYKIKGTSTLGEVAFLWTSSTDNMTVQDMINELSYKLSSGSGFSMGIPASLEETGGNYNVGIVADGGATVYLGSQSGAITLTTVYKIY